MRAFILFLIFLALLAQLYFLAQNYGVKDDTSGEPMAERALADKEPGATPEKKLENPVRGIEALRGVVLGEDGAPIADTAVTLVQTDLDTFDAFRVPRKRDTWHLTTDAQGLFSVNTLAPGSYVVQTSGARGAAAAMATLEARGSAGEVVLRPARGRKVSGGVVDWEGRPVKGAHVFALAPVDAAPELLPYRYLPAVTAADGSFVFSNIPAIEMTFLAVADELAPGLIREADMAQEKPGPLRFTLGKGARLAGYLTEAETARPAEKTALVVTEREFGMERYRKYTTGAASFLFDNLRPGSYDIAVESPRYALETCPLTVEVRDGLGNLDVRMVRAGRVKGRVVQEGGREGVPGIRIVATSQDGKDRHESTSGPSGYYALEGLSPGIWQVEADDPHGDFAVEGNKEVEVPPGRAVDGPGYTMKRGATISGRVVDETGRAVIGANVFVSLHGGRTGDRSTRTGEDGRFEQAGIPPESEVRVWAERLGRVSVALGPEKVPASGLHELTFTLAEEALGSISGMVVDTLGRPAAEVPVQCVTPDQSLREPLLVQSGADGGFHFDQVPKGAYRLLTGRAADQMIPESAQELTLNPGQRAEGLRLVLP
jgi:hypothetical protein